MLRPFPFPALVGSHTLRDVDLKYYLSYRRFIKHNGFEIEEADITYVIKITDSESHPKNTILLYPSTQVGTASTDARHYYGHLHLPRVIYEPRKKGAFPQYFLNQSNILQKVELTRKLTVEEIQSTPERFISYCSGDYFHGFLTEESVRGRAKDIVSTLFPGFRLAMKRLEYDPSPIKENEWIIKNPAHLVRPEKHSKPKTPSQQMNLFELL